LTCDKRLSRSLKIFKCSRATRVVVYLALVAALVTFLVIDTADERDRLISFLGLVVFILFGFVFSKHPSRVSHVIDAWWATVNRKMI